MFQDGQQIAEKTIRVNDPLDVGGYTFHQNGFGPAPDVVIRDADGPAAVDRPDPDDRAGRGLPVRRVRRARAATSRSSCCSSAQEDGTGVLLVLPFRAVGRERRRHRRQIVGLEPLALTVGESAIADGTDFSVELRGFERVHAADREAAIPGQRIVWIGVRAA